MVRLLCDIPYLHSYYDNFRDNIFSLSLQNKIVSQVLKLICGVLPAYCLNCERPIRSSLGRAEGTNCPALLRYSVRLPMRCSSDPHARRNISTTTERSTWRTALEESLASSTNAALNPSPTPGRRTPISLILYPSV